MNAQLKTFGTILPVAAALLLYGRHAMPMGLDDTAPAAQTQSSDMATGKGGEDHTATKAGWRAGEQIDDSAITTKIESKLLAEPELRSFKVTVDTHDGNVTLGGKVKNAQQAQRAKQIAMETKGVRKVKSNLEVEKNQ